MKLPPFAQQWSVEVAQLVGMGVAAFLTALTTIGGHLLMVGGLRSEMRGLRTEVARMRGEIKEGNVQAREDRHELRDEVHDINLRVTAIETYREVRTRIVESVKQSVHARNASNVRASDSAGGQ